MGKEPDFGLILLDYSDEGGDVTLATFVSVGNATQSFNRMLDAVSSLAASLPKPIIVQHGNSTFQGAGCIARPFMEMAEFSLHVEEAGLLILHAGAGSVIQAVRAGKVPVVMPRRAKYGEHVDDHQLEFARALAETGKVLVVEEPEALISAIEEAIKLQSKLHPLNKRPALVDLIDEIFQRYAAVIDKSTTP